MKLFIGDLTPWMTEDRILEQFSRYGSVDSVEIIRDRSTGRSRRYGFVGMPREREAKKAAKALNGSYLQGLYLRVAPTRQEDGCSRRVTLKR